MFSTLANGICLKYCTIHRALNKCTLINPSQNSFHCLNRTNKNRKIEKQIYLSKLGKESPQSLSTSLALTQIGHTCRKYQSTLLSGGFLIFVNFGFPCQQKHTICFYFLNQYSTKESAIQQK